MTTLVETYDNCTLNAYREALAEGDHQLDAIRQSVATLEETIGKSEDQDYLVRRGLVDRIAALEAKLVTPDPAATVAVPVKTLWEWEFCLRGAENCIEQGYPGVADPLIEEVHQEIIAALTPYEA